MRSAFSRILVLGFVALGIFAALPAISSAATGYYAFLASGNLGLPEPHFDTPETLAPVEAAPVPVVDEVIEQVPAAAEEVKDVATENLEQLLPFPENAIRDIVGSASNIRIVDEDVCLDEIVCVDPVEAGTIIVERSDVQHTMTEWYGIIASAVKNAWAQKASGILGG